WNELLFYVRARLCLERLKDISFDAVFVGTELGLAEAILAEIGIPFSTVNRGRNPNLPRYYFPIHDWTKEKIRRRGLKALLLNLYTWTLGSLLSLGDRVLGEDDRRPIIFVQIYQPTLDLYRR